MARIDDEKRQFTIATARRLIYEKNYLVHGTAVEDLLKPTSLVPTAVGPCMIAGHIASDHKIDQNMFSKRLRPLGFNMFSMFVVDLMHDFELGGWRAIFVHLLRMLDLIVGE
jgi:hypothetical protein